MGRSDGGCRADGGLLRNEVVEGIPTVGCSGAKNSDGEIGIFGGKL